MMTMRTMLSAALFCAMLAPVGMVAAAPTPAPAPTATMPPEIYRGTIRPLCSALRTKIAPSIAMLRENDKTIAKSPQYFKDFGTAQFNQSEGAKNMALNHLEYLVSPLANNVLAIQKLLEDPSVFPPNPLTEDDKQKDQLKKQLMQSLAQQQAALDIINGFVDTQNLASMQHDGFGYIGAMIGNDQRGQSSRAYNDLTATPDPTKPQPFDDTVIRAGLPTNPWEIDLTRIPGLSLGYNPVNNLKQGVEWTQGQSKKTESQLAKTVIQTVQICGGHQPAAAPTP